MTCEKCNRPADILIHQHKFCMKHYEEYHYKQSEALLPFKFMVDEQETFEDIFGDAL